MAAFVSFDNNKTFYNVAEIVSVQEIGYPPNALVTFRDGTRLSVSGSAASTVSQIRQAASATW